ncbi:MAG: HAMP domain-containing protein, partial [Betaproteobacteria bacterium]
MSDTSATMYLTSADGAIIASSRGLAPNLLGAPYTPKAYARLRSKTNRTVTYTSISGTDVAGTLRHVPQVSWLIIAELPTRAAFNEVRQFRNIALVVVFLLLIVVAGSAYWLGVFIVRPLERLARGAAEVALGDFSVDLPNPGGGEVGVLTGVFNSMVKRLREGREELERLSITDGLTGLTNHRELM